MDPLQEHVDRIKEGASLELGKTLPQEYLDDLKDVGHFDVESTTLVISDPCYELGTWCAGTVHPVKLGRWHVSVERGDYVGWGERICKLVAIHKHHVKGDLEFKLTSIDVGVDSGQAGIFDLKYYRNDELTTEADMGPSEDGYRRREEEGDKFYDACCRHTLNPQQVGCLLHGAVSSSGVGDGSYNCYVAMVNDEIVGVVIDFLVGPEHAECEDDEDDRETCPHCGLDLDPAVEMPNGQIVCGPCADDRVGELCDLDEDYGEER